MTGFTLTSPSTEANARALETDHASREDDPTPRGVTRAALEAAITVDIEDGPCVGVEPGDTHGERMTGHALRRSYSEEPVRVLDVGAGYGCWSSEIRKLAARQGWPVHITGVELFEPRRADLEKWCDEVVIGDWRNVAPGRVLVQDSFDLVIGNPHFTALTHEDPEQSMPAVLLRHAPAVLLLHTQQAFARGEAGRRVWRAYPPAASWVVPGSVKFRAGYNPKCRECGTHNKDAQSGECWACAAKLKSWGSDQRCYQVSLWLRGHEGATALHMLPELPPGARRWTVPPGSEEPSGDLPAAPGWSP